MNSKTVQLFAGDAWAVEKIDDLFVIKGDAEHCAADIADDVAVEFNGERFNCRVHYVTSTFDYLRVFLVARELPNA